MAQCPSCGGTTEAGNRFCASCGVPVTPTGAVGGTAGAVPWYRTGSGVLGIGMTLAAVAVVVVVLIVSQGDDGTAAGPAPTGTVATVPGTGATTPPTEPTTTTSASTEPTTTTSTTTPTTIPTGFTQEFRDAFMDGCRRAGNRAFCRCALNAFEESYTQDELAAILNGDMPAPDDFSGPSIGCYTELPESAPLADFALPNTCTVDTWGMVVHYPTGWAVEDEVRACFAYRPDDAPPGSMAVIVGFHTDTTMDEYLASSAPSSYVVEHLNRDVHVWVTPVGESVGVEFVFRLWEEIPDGPLVVVMAETSVTVDAWTVADMMIRALEIAPYSP